MGDGDRDAAFWFATLRDPDCSDDDRAEFEEWLAVPENAAAFGRVSANWERSGDFAKDPDVLAYLDGLSVRRDGASADPSMLCRPGIFWSILNAATRMFPGPTVRWASAMAVVGALVLGIVAISNSDRHQTALGERRVITLHDGSRVTLNTASAIRVQFGSDERVVTLSAGEALFEVAPDPSRPFTVEAACGRVTAVGTEFLVDLRGQEVTVTLLEGVVAVEAGSSQEPEVETLEPGDQLSYSEEVGVTEKTSADLEATTAWIEGNLIFRDELLADALAEVNRYHERKIKLGSAVPKDIRVSGVFLIEERAPLIMALERTFNLRAVSQSNGDIILMPTV